MAGLLDNKVVVISGVGPALGTTLARRCAEAGADLVLAARTVERLEDVAKQVTDTGRRAVSVGTDITDEEQVNNLISESLKAYGRVDVLINNAFRVPSMKPFANTTFDHIRETIELTVLGALRLIQGFTPALAESNGSIVNVNSMVVRHSDPKQGAYKMAKSALLAMSQSLASELGPQGIRVNSVLPGYIWGGTLKGYFEHQAGKYGTTVDDLHASAVKACGLDDFGVDDDNYREALGVLLESFQRDADLTELGSKMNRFFVRNALVARLVSEAAWKQYPQHADVTIERPIFVTGLPRTGTTALHRLLSADPRHQGLELWLAEFPQPRPPRETWSDNPVFQQLDAQFTKAHNENPDYTGLHYMTADDVEECWQLLRQSLHSVSYETLAHLPTYSQWLARQDWTRSYQRHRRNLQLIGLNEAEKRWVLKNPSHLFALDAVFATYPDALVIQCHRPAGTIMASMCSLAQHTTEGWSNTFVGATIGQDSLETWSRGLELFNTERAKHDSAQFYDMDYFDFIADPVREVEAIYRHFGIGFTDAARATAAETHAESKKGPRAPKHTYSLADYGLTDEQVKERFKGL